MATMCAHARSLTKFSRTFKAIVTRTVSCVTCVSSTKRFLTNSSALLAGRKYSEKHEWVELNSNIGTIGITHYAQDALGDIVYAQLPEVGTELKASDECGALESVKAASELYSPISGKVTETNAEVEDKPGLINSSCYDKGWLFKLETTNSKELDDLMDEESYHKFLKSLDE